MAYFPFMINIEDRRVLIAGGGTVAYRKVLSMLEFGACVTVVSPELCDELVRLYQDMSGVCESEDKDSQALTEIGDKDFPALAETEDRDFPALAETAAACVGADRLTIVRRRIEPCDIDGAFVVIMATDDSAVNHEIAELCKERNILVNVVDVKADCGFYFPAILRDGDVVIGVSTGGRSPMLAGAIKKDIAGSINKNYGEIAERLGSLREQIKSEYASEEERKAAFAEIMRELLVDSDGR